MVKVLYVSYNGLLEPILPSQTIPYLSGLARKGYEFLLFTFEKKEGLRKTGRAGLKRLSGELKSLGIEWHHLTYHKSPRLLATLYDLCAGAFCCLHLIVSHKVKIVHVRGITPGSIVLILAKFLDIKILFDMRGLLAEEIAAGGGWKEGGAAFRLVKKAEKGLLKRADAVSVLTHKHLEFNRRLDIFKDREVPMDVIPCCVDLEKFNYDAAMASAFRKKLAISEGAFILMYQGKIGSFYFMDEMVDFFKSMLAAKKESVFSIITNDPIEPVMMRSSGIGIAKENIIPVHGIGFESMPNYIEIADTGIFFINPRNKLGSSPIKMGEFLASGVPVIINPGVGDTEEIVRENKVGVVVRDFTIASYKAALDELFKLKTEGDALRKRCRETARRYLSLGDGINRYADLYQKLSGDFQ